MSPISRSQESFPDRWQRFYERVGAMWGRLTGDAEGTASRIVEVLFRCGVLFSGCAVLDVGCGPGCLAIALDQAGCFVTAVDQSSAMIQAVQEATGRLSLKRIKTLFMRWEEVPAGKEHDVAIAAFFPAAFSPEGVQTLENHARHSCVLVASSSPHGLPFRGSLWRTLMDDFPPNPRHAIQCALNTLWTMGRLPFLYHLQWPYVFDQDEGTVREFYRHYFQVFGVCEKRFDEALCDCLRPFCENGRIRVQGEMRVSLLWWQVPGCV